MKKLVPYEENFPLLPKVYLSIACMAKNEGPYLREWLEYHRMLGVERFYLYDNESEDDTTEILKPYIEEGLVAYHFTPGQSMMFPSYADAIYRCQEQSRWLAFIDLDEFLVPKQHDDLREFLKDYEQYPGLGVNWIVFDSGGHETRPTEHGGLVTANYTRIRSDRNYDGKQSYLTVKSIVDPTQVLGMPSAHFAAYRDGKSAVNENFEPISGVFSRVNSTEKIQLNHYFTKSKEEYVKRLEKGRCDTKQAKVYREEDVNFKSTSNDYAIQRFVPRLMQALGIKE